MKLPENLSHWKQIGFNTFTGRCVFERTDGYRAEVDKTHVLAGDFSHLGRHDEARPLFSPPAPARLPESLVHWKQTGYDYPTKGYAFRRDDGELAFASNADVAKGDFRALLRHDALHPMPAPAEPEARRATRKFHMLKTWPEPFQAVWDGRKRFEYRKNDRDYLAGDVLVLEEWCPEKKAPTGRIVVAEVTYLARHAFGIPDGYCVMDIETSCLFHPYTPPATGDSHS